MQRNPRPVVRPLLAAIALLPLALTAQAAGYRFGTQSAAAEGTANANGAEAADASTLFANPAGITRLGKGWNFSGVLDYVDPKTRFTDEGSTISLPGSGLQPRAIGTVGDTMSFAKPQVVPHAYLSYQGDNGLAYGLGVFVPWGTKLNYPANWGGRYNLQSVELKSLSINPNIAWKAAPELSLAAGLNIQYMEGKLKRAVPYASVYAAGLLGAAHQAAVGGAPGLALQLQQQAAQVFGDPSYDGSIAVDGSNWGLGFNLSLLWEPAAGSRVGVSYRSSVAQKLRGHADWTQPTNLPAAVLAAITAAPYNGVTALDHNDSDASLSVRTPESLSAHGFQQLTPSVAIMGDFTFTRDSRLKQLRIDFANTTADSITAEHWKDSTKVSIGAQWKALPSLMLRTGYSRDLSPVPSATRSPALPDAARTWFALGANWAFMDNASVDFSFGHVKLKDAAMNATDDGDGETPCNCSFATARGNYATKATVFGVQFNYKF
ncbi:OmpP1/FadL family transporter [Roseateles saccharophilus]|uniref:Long-chain fatty acid transport protein n=1 Tax=Roseateles saccharophilus TaxID=304 RepID=A0A4R3VI91_ROSSA|nr:outer membrane protein transport protein [Roseateles saccharophilus]MDG0832806.1 transporter [Roseateles saccharophilus]TCV03833.1 long-chain fatty acid transport protein [Roseateles saccharophilus]